jgi:hypothetical protein
MGACVVASMPLTAGRADDGGSPINGVEIPAEWAQAVCQDTLHQA